MKTITTINKILQMWKTNTKSTVQFIQIRFEIYIQPHIVCISIQDCNWLHILWQKGIRFSPYFLILSAWRAHSLLVPARQMMLHIPWDAQDGFPCCLDRRVVGQFLQGRLFKGVLIFHVGRLFGVLSFRIQFKNGQCQQDFTK